MRERHGIHVTQLHEKGSGHRPHIHEETEIILVISAESGMTIDGKIYSRTACNLYFTLSQLRHGVRNSSDDELCYYFAFLSK